MAARGSVENFSQTAARLARLKAARAEKEKVRRESQENELEAKKDAFRRASSDPPAPAEQTFARVASSPPTNEFARVLEDDGVPPPVPPRSRTPVPELPPRHYSLAADRNPSYAEIDSGDFNVGRAVPLSGQGGYENSLAQHNRDTDMAVHASRSSQDRAFAAFTDHGPPPVEQDEVSQPVRPLAGDDQAVVNQLVELMKQNMSRFNRSLDEAASTNPALGGAQPDLLAGDAFVVEQNADGNSHYEEPARPHHSTDLSAEDQALLTGLQQNSYAAEVDMLMTPVHGRSMSSLHVGGEEGEIGTSQRWADAGEPALPQVFENPLHSHSPPSPPVIVEPISPSLQPQPTYDNNPTAVRTVREEYVDVDATMARGATMLPKANALGMLPAGAVHQQFSSEKKEIVFSLPPIFGQFSFNAPGRSIVSLRHMKKIFIVGDEWEFQRLALVVLTDVAFLAQPIDGRIYLVLQRPCPREAVHVTLPPAHFGHTVLQLWMNAESHLIKVSSEAEVTYWMGKLNSYARRASHPPPP